MDSRGILEALTANMETYINDGAIIYENYFVEPSRMEAKRQDIKKARISLYEAGDNPAIRVDSYRTFETTQEYTVQLSYVLAYRGDSSELGELPMLEIKDKVAGWVQQVDASALTDCELSTLYWSGSRIAFRGERLTTLEISLTARREMI